MANNFSNARNTIREDLCNTICGKEFFEFICGDLLGIGQHRAVFVYTPDPSCVIKFQRQIGPQNWLEWQLFHDLFEHANQLLLAPCLRISENGIWLVQRRTQPVPKNFQWPKKIPEFITDTKRPNFGIYKKRLVCHDYANNLCENYARTVKMKKVEWRDE